MDGIREEFHDRTEAQDFADDCENAGERVHVFPPSTWPAGRKTWLVRSVN